MPSVQQLLTDPAYFNDSIEKNKDIAKFARNEDTATDFFKQNLSPYTLIRFHQNPDLRSRMLKYINSYDVDDVLKILFTPMKLRTDVKASKAANQLREQQAIWLSGIAYLAQNDSEILEAIKKEPYNKIIRDLISRYPEDFNFYMAYAAYESFFYAFRLAEVDIDKLNLAVGTTHYSIPGREAYYSSEGESWRLEYLSGRHFEDLPWVLFDFVQSFNKSDSYQTVIATFLFFTKASSYYLDHLGEYLNQVDESKMNNASTLHNNNIDLYLARRSSDWKRDECVAESSTDVELKSKSKPQPTEELLAFLDTLNKQARELLKHKTRDYRAFMKFLERYQDVLLANQDRYVYLIAFGAMNTQIVFDVQEKMASTLLKRVYEGGKGAVEEATILNSVMKHLAETSPVITQKIAFDILSAPLRCLSLRNKIGFIKFLLEHGNENWKKILTDVGIFLLAKELQVTSGRTPALEHLDQYPIDHLSDEALREISNLFKASNPYVELHEALLDRKSAPDVAANKLIAVHDRCDGDGTMAMDAMNAISNIRIQDIVVYDGKSDSFKRALFRSNDPVSLATNLHSFYNRRAEKNPKKKLPTLLTSVSGLAAVEDGKKNGLRKKSF